MSYELKICGDANGAHIHEYLKMPVAHTYEKKPKKMPRGTYMGMSMGHTYDKENSKECRRHKYGDANGAHIRDKRNVRMIHCLETS